MTDLTTLNAAELAGKIHSREVSSVEVTQAHLDRIAAVDTEYHAFLHVAGEQALEAAAAVDNSLAGGNEPASALAGVPIALKDIFTTTDMPTTCASKILEGWVAPYDATLTSKLRAAGIPILGKTNLDEFAMGSSTENSAFGPTRNPWDVTRIPGGSGGGSAAALASRQAPLAIGTDTGGSIRQPAAVTATVGTKRRTELSHASGSSRAPPRSIRAVPVVAPCSTPLYCTRSSPGTIRVTPRPSTPPCVRWSLRHVKVQPATCAASKSVWSRNFTPTATSPASSLPSTLPSSNSRLWVPKLSRSRARASSMRSRRTTWCCPARSRPTWLASTPCATDCVSTTAT